jgi:FMN phosphatase YigB (HAD superfamily)
MQFRNLIFDLGGVIIDLSVDETVKAFSWLSGLSAQQIYDRYHSHPEFLAYEKGELTDDEFREAVKRIFSFDATVEDFDRCWNAMLLGLPVKKLALLEHLRSGFSLTVLSNTNSIHLRHVDEAILPKVAHGKSLNDYFHHHYYSHLVRKRKPEPEIFIQVLDENRFEPNETLFLDDNADNIKSAKAVGLNAWLVDHPDRVFEYLKDFVP